MSRHQLAQINVARLLAPIDAPETADFVAALAPVNARAEESPGFVWRLQTESGDATAVRASDDPLLIVNLTVWDSVEALEAFDASGFAAFAQAWMARDALVERRIRVEGAHGTFDGIAAGVDARGALRVRTDGGMCVIDSAEVTVRPE